MRNCCSHPVNGVCADPVVTAGQQGPKDPFGPSSRAPGPRSLGVPLPLTSQACGWRRKAECGPGPGILTPALRSSQSVLGPGQGRLPSVSMAPLGLVPPPFLEEDGTYRRISQLSPTGSKGALQKGTLHLHDHCSGVQVPPLILVASGQYSQRPSVILTPPAVGQTHLPCIPRLQEHVPRFP